MKTTFSPRTTNSPRRFSAYSVPTNSRSMQSCNTKLADCTRAVLPPIITTILFLKFFADLFFDGLTKLIKRSQHAVKLCARRHTGLTQHHQHTLCATIERRINSMYFFFHSCRTVNVANQRRRADEKLLKVVEHRRSQRDCCLCCLLLLLLLLTRGLLRCC
jgi:hypothetical protein